MKKSAKKTTESTKAASEPEIITPEVEEVYETKTNLIYNFINFFIGGDNRADIKNKQEGKPGSGTPPPY